MAQALEPQCPGRHAGRDHLRERDPEETVEITVAQSATLDHPTAVFNASLSVRTRRAINLNGGDDLDDAFKGLVTAAAEHNVRQ